MSWLRILLYFALLLFLFAVYTGSWISAQFLFLVSNATGEWVEWIVARMEQESRNEMVTGD